MADRVMKVNAFTTLDLVEGTAEGHGFEESALATLNVTAPRKDPDHVSLQLELDNVELDELPPHADSVTLSPEEARALAGDLEKYADKVEAAQSAEGDGEAGEVGEPGDTDDDGADGGETAG